MLIEIPPTADLSSTSVGTGATAGLLVAAMGWAWRRLVDDSIPLSNANVIKIKGL